MAPAVIWRIDTNILYKPKSLNIVDNCRLNYIFVLILVLAVKPELCLNECCNWHRHTKLVNNSQDEYVTLYSCRHVVT